MDYWTDEGGNAFPACEKADQNGTMGMTLRDYFAGQALTSIASMHHGTAFDPNGCATSAYEIADAMIKAREASNDQPGM